LIISAALPWKMLFTDSLSYAARVLAFALAKSKNLLLLKSVST